MTIFTDPYEHNGDIDKFSFGASNQFSVSFTISNQSANWPGGPGAPPVGLTSDIADAILTALQSVPNAVLSGGGMSHSWGDGEGISFP